MGTRRVAIYNAAGEHAGYRTVQTPDHRVRFSKPDWSEERTDAWPLIAINRRGVRVDGDAVGHLYGIQPAPNNPHRPTEFVFITADGKRITGIDRMENARIDIEQHFDRNPDALDRAKRTASGEIVPAAEQIQAHPAVLNIGRIPHPATDTTGVMLTLRLTERQLRDAGKAIGLSPALIEQYLIETKADR